MKATIYHNPRCSKSRQTLALLQENDVDVEIIEYMKTPPDEKQLKSILKKLALSPVDLLRKQEPLFKELGLANRLNDEQALLKAMLANPVLIERPIVLANNMAAIGRPPENVLALLS